MAETRTKRQKQADEMRARIQVTALALFNEKGFENVSIEEIARNVGCSVGNIYHYFPNKESLTVMLTANVDIKYKALHKRYLGDTERPVRDRLVDFVGEALEIDSQEDLLFQCFVHSIKYPEQGFLKPDVSKEYFGMLYRLVKELFEKCSIKEGYSLEEVLHSLIVINRGLLFEWRIEEGHFDIAERGRNMTLMMLDGIIVE